MKIIYLINGIFIIVLLVIWAITGKRLDDWYVALMLSLFAINSFIKLFES